MNSDLKETFRNFLKDSIRLAIDFSTTDQNKGVPPPPLQKPCDTNQTYIFLPHIDDCEGIEKISLISAFQKRESRRIFKKKSMTIDELSFLLWATQGIRKTVNTSTAFRIVPSAGCRHSFETYLAVNDVSDLSSGIYRYLPIEHALVFEQKVENLSKQLSVATLNQSFVGKAPVTFIWTTLPYRMEWRYDLSAHRVIAIDAGHVCQNLYLACEAIQAGTCAIAAFHQEKIDKLIGVDGVDEFVIYLAPVGKRK
ncbi:thioester oxidase [Candidatus Magnetomorum sp. HK-1]|nr:thioester oxidase [Candidatus Magnetomorum sp. HK-1]